MVKRVKGKIVMELEEAEKEATKTATALARVMVAYYAELIQGSVPEDTAKILLSEYHKQFATQSFGGTTLQQLIKAKPRP